MPQPPRTREAYRRRYHWFAALSGFAMAIAFGIVIALLCDDDRHPKRGEFRPLILGAVMLATPFLIWLADNARRRMLAVPPATRTCRRCGYDLRASPVYCPECGANTIARGGVGSLDEPRRGGTL